jgi:hypothetical protein
MPLDYSSPAPVEATVPTVLGCHNSHPDIKILAMLVDSIQRPTNERKSEWIDGDAV